MVPWSLLSLLLLARPAPGVAYSVSLPASFLEDVAGSGEAEGSSASSPSLLPPRTPPFSPTPGRPQPTALDGPVPPTNLLDGIMDFFRQYVMLIAVVGSLTFLVMFLVCAALITRQKHKATAYYPSSFPEKKYVDQRDRAGGPRAFSEVPDRAPDSRPEEGLDSSQQLQADILAATQNLRSPARALPGSGEGTKPAKGGSEEEEEVLGGQEEAQEAPVCGVTEEKLGAPEESASAEAEGVPAASEGQWGPEGSLSLAPESQGAAGAPESPCACSRVPPSV
ncbi:transmembrane protein 119 [Apodemus sylvaticus]|uniref:transmembrane protein 119 n=1 Tax=Apodemus sylvaticus TaxID=10129 RepID=UPI002243DAAF|nr:transmembrane protein 119 [Apodemus sylvaticus]